MVDDSKELRTSSARDVRHAHLNRDHRLVLTRARAFLARLSAITGDKSGVDKSPRKNVARLSLLRAAGRVNKFSFARAAALRRCAAARRRRARNSKRQKRRAAAAFCTRSGRALAPVPSANR